MSSLVMSHISVKFSSVQKILICSMYRFDTIDSKMNKKPLVSLKEFSLGREHQLLVGTFETMFAMPYS